MRKRSKTLFTTQLENVEQLFVMWKVRIQLFQTQISADDLILFNDKHVTNCSCFAYQYICGLYCKNIISNSNNRYRLGTYQKYSPVLRASISALCFAQNFRALIFCPNISAYDY